MLPPASPSSGFMKLIQIFLPLEDNQGNRFSAADFNKVKLTLTEKFGGMTPFTQAPATGLWEDKNDKLVQDRLVIFEVMTPELEQTWWRNYRTALESEFRQDLIVIRVFDVYSV